jgi:hypothetical protein
MDFQQGDIVRIWVDDELPDPDYNLPGEGWDAIVVDVDQDEITLEVAWLERFTAPVNERAKPIRESWDDHTALVVPTSDAHVKLLRRATYTNVEVAVG